MAWFDTARQIGELVKTYNNINLQIKNIENILEALRSEFVSIRLEQLKLGERVSRLEEGRETIKAQMQSISDKSVADVKVMKAEMESNLKVQAVLVQADIYRKMFDKQSSLSNSEQRLIE